MSFYDLFIILLIICLLVSMLAQGVSVPRVIIIDQSGFGHFRNLRDAINSVPVNNNQWVEIRIKAGIYQEKILIPNDKQYISLVGEGRLKTVIQWSDGGGRQTLEYPTFSVLANNTLVRDITFKNLYHPGTISQAPAAAIHGDKVAFYGCGFVGVQDTLTDFEGRHYFEGCYIQGYVDFIWGYGQSIYLDCMINVTSGGYDDRTYGAGYITAQGRLSIDAPDGFVFKYCRVVGTSLAHLGRAYQAHSRVVFFKTYLSNIIVPQGWSNRFIRGHEDTTTHEEIECTGPGANLSQRVKWGRRLTSQELNFLLNTNTFINQDHWLENLPVPRKTPYFFKYAYNHHLYKDPN